ncbi:DUF2625 family protein [Amycolatopsis sp. NPDC059090]|uniref:DUF2625 family protein n=1 Tax=Amycolatopsis sp. NPDC059090 TaxID=3346723 RepID=UPI00366E125E
MRDIAELVDVPDPSWPVLSNSFAASLVSCAVLPSDPERCRKTLHQLQVTARSPLGAIALNTGGILVHEGWVKVYGGSGGGPAGLPGMAEVNCFPESVEDGWQPAAGLIIAHDVLGGEFVLNGMAPGEYGRPGAPGGVIYFSPATLTWHDLEMGHSGWLRWLLEGGAASHYSDLMWPTWRTDLAGLGLRDGISVYPFLWSAEAQREIAATIRKPVPLELILSMHGDFCVQFGLPKPGWLGTRSADDGAVVPSRADQGHPASARLATFHDERRKVTVGIFRQESRGACRSHIDLPATVAGDMVVVGGGGVSWNPGDPAAPNGTLLTTSGPNADLDAWLVSSKDHHYHEPHMTVAYATGLAIEGMTREELRDAIYVGTAQAYGNRPEATAAVPEGFVLIGGGARVDVVAGDGNLLTASFPSGDRSWTARAKDHLHESNATLTVFALGLRENLPVGHVEVAIASQDSPVVPHPVATAVLSESYAVVGGGADVHWHGAGSLLWRLEPSASAGRLGFTAGAKDHERPDPSSLTAYVLGIRITDLTSKPLAGWRGRLRGVDRRIRRSQSGSSA